MRSRTCLMVMLLFLSSVVYAQRKQAFLVGISHYDTALTGYQWNDINGVEDVKLLSPVLKKQGFHISSILDEQATYEGISRQLNQFVRNTKKGDIVYLHFSAHGQPVEDLNGDEEDGWDESIVPIDAYKMYKKGLYEGEKHLLDDQLNKYIMRLRERIGPTGLLYVVIDACHAGRSSRANDETVRGTHVGFTYHGKVFKPSANKQSHFRIECSTKLSDVLFLEACRADQVNTEIKVGGKRYGPLSYNITQALLNYPLSTNAKEFLKRIRASQTIAGRWPNNQNLVVEQSY